MPWKIEHREPSEVLAIALPRAQLEGILGSARKFVGLSCGSGLPVTRLAQSFMLKMLHEAENFDAESAARMTSIGVDLIAASIAERMASDLPQTLQGTVLVQRAKAFAVSNLGDPDLTSTHVAAAVGISLRHLQSLFRENGQSVTAWIWEQRLERAAQRLARTSGARLPLGELAAQCGFADQAHFSRRFRERYGVTPSSYRASFLTKSSAD